MTANELLELLRECEWAGDGRDESLCPICGGSKPYDSATPLGHGVGHDRDCRMAAAVKSPYRVTP